MKNIWKQFWKMFRGILKLVPKTFKWFWKRKWLSCCLIAFWILCYVGVVSTSRLVRYLSNVGRTVVGREEVQRPSDSNTGFVVIPSVANQNQQRQRLPQVQTSGSYTTPVRDFTPQAQWIGTVKMFRDQNGYFITAPGVRVNEGVPFEEFAQKHPDQARIILGR